MMLCIVCERELIAPHIASCAQCHASFHLAISNNAGIQDCGRIVYVEEYQGLVTFCERCVAILPPEMFEEPVIDPFTPLPPI